MICAQFIPYCFSIYYGFGPSTAVIVSDSYLHYTMFNQNNGYVADF